MLLPFQPTDTVNTTPSTLHFLIPLTGAVAAAVLLTACGSMMSSPAQPMFSQDSPPDAIKVPAGNKVAMETVGVGEITYECRNKANMPDQTERVFVGPKAVATSPWTPTMAHLPPGNRRTAPS